jgi:hypothetical protein
MRSFIYRHRPYWQLINNKNAIIQLPQNAFIFSSLAFNETVIREAILNAIGNRYLAAELELLLSIFRGQGLKIGELETALSASLNRNQIKYLLFKLQEDSILVSEGKGKGTHYNLKAPWNSMEGMELVNNVIFKLRELYPAMETATES